jgi:hypothetical protein
MAGCTSVGEERRDETEKALTLLTLNEPCLESNQKHLANYLMIQGFRPRTEGWFQQEGNCICVTRLKEEKCEQIKSIHDVGLI